VGLVATCPNLTWQHPMRLQARSKERPGRTGKSKAGRERSGCKRRHSLDQSDGGPWASWNRSPIHPILSYPIHQDPFPPTLSHSGQAEPETQPKPKPELARVWPPPSGGGLAQVLTLFRTLGIYGVNSTQTSKSDRPPRTRLHDRGGPGPSLFPQLTHRQQLPLESPIARTASSRQKHPLSFPTDRLEACGLDCLRLIIGVRARGELCSPFGLAGDTIRYTVPHRGVPMSRV
jgi:hypothetical protein